MFNPSIRVLVDDEKPALACAIVFHEVQLLGIRIQPNLNTF